MTGKVICAALGMVMVAAVTLPSSARDIDGPFDDMPAVEATALNHVRGGMTIPSIKDIVVVRAIAGGISEALVTTAGGVKQGISEALVTTAGGVKEAIGRIKVRFSFGRAD
ncbi:MAG: hypothetical protein QNJ94_17510 [Alphaproteobacteria bacterium]|nr:hypothetical protein [Alphaproteobacteria bacterium]